MVDIKKAIQNINWEQVINWLMHIALSIFAGTWVVAFSIPFEEGMLIAQHLASVVISFEVVGKAILSMGISWLGFYLFKMKLPMKPVKLYWLYVGACWLFTLVV